MAGLTIIGVKVVGICSKCREDVDEIPRNKDGSIIPDKDISCLNKAFGNCPGVQPRNPTYDVQLKERELKNER